MHVWNYSSQAIKKKHRLLDNENKCISKLPVELYAYLTAHGFLTEYNNWNIVGGYNVKAKLGHSES